MHFPRGIFAPIKSISNVEIQEGETITESFTVALLFSLTVGLTGHQHLDYSKSIKIQAIVKPNYLIGIL